jgi:nicotinamidase-related amidase
MTNRRSYYEHEAEAAMSTARRLIEGKPAVLVIEDGSPVAPCLALLLAACREHHVPVITSAGAKTPSPAPRRADEYLSSRPRSSAFFATSLDVLLRELDARTILVAGGQTSVSVHYTFVDAHQHDYFCRVVEDSMTGSTPRAHEAALAAMEYMQTGARRTSSEVIAALGAS